jgi:hypothetical protein
METQTIKINKVYRLVAPLKGWPVEDANTLEDATHQILGSPYWDIPEDDYIVVDKNDTYSLLAVCQDGKPLNNIHYLAVNINLVEKLHFSLDDL